VRTRKIAILIVAGSGLCSNPSTKASQVSFAPAGINRFIGTIDNSVAYTVTVNGEPWRTTSSGDPRPISADAGGRYQAVLSHDDDLLSFNFAEGGSFWGINSTGTPSPREFGDWRGFIGMSSVNGLGPSLSTDGDVIPQGNLRVRVTVARGQFPNTRVVERESLLPVVWDEPVTAGAVERISDELTAETWLIHDIEGPWANPNAVLFDEFLDGERYVVRLERFGMTGTDPNPVPFGIPEPSTIASALFIAAILVALRIRRFGNSFA